MDVKAWVNCNSAKCILYVRTLFDWKIWSGPCYEPCTGKKIITNNSQTFVTSVTACIQWCFAEPCSSLKNIHSTPLISIMLISPQKMHLMEWLMSQSFVRQLRRSLTQMCNRTKSNVMTVNFASCCAKTLFWQSFNARHQKEKGTLWPSFTFRFWIGDTNPRLNCVHEASWC